MGSADQGLIGEAHLLAVSGEGRVVREAAGLSLGEMSSATGASGLTLMRWENGEMLPVGTAAADWVRVIRMLRKRGNRRPVPW